MALIRKLEKEKKDFSPRTKADGFVSTIFRLDGEKRLQVRAVGSGNRQNAGATRQIIRFSPRALQERQDFIEKGNL
ncbi:MAG: hypothetical protein LBD68_08970 [Zoogloeaceae bacterium]|jgi:hypothetical protein|nr:hypothetical protein [Zoogloeaceae bacterium]